MALLNCLSAVVDTVYLEITADKRKELHLNLWILMSALVYLSQGNPVKEAIRNVEQLCSSPCSLISM